MKKTIKKMVVVFLVVMSTFVLSAFEWSQKSVVTEVGFSENKGDCFSSKINYAEAGTVFAAEDGVSVLAIQPQAEMGWFNSALGNVLVLVHGNNMMTVYSNLDEGLEITEKMDIKSGDIIANSGDSEWHDQSDNVSGSGFGIIDTKMHAIINPVILMKDVPASDYVRIEGLQAINRRGEIIDIYNGVSIEAGQYILYMKKPNDLMIRESQVLLNGEVKEIMSYDSILQSASTIVIQGNQRYVFREVYPDDKNMRLAEVLLQRGVNTIEIVLSSNGDTKTNNYYRFNVK